MRLFGNVKIIGVLLALVLLSPLAAEGVQVSTSDGRGADTYIHNDEPLRNFGADELLLIKNDALLGPNDRKGYLRFDLSGIQGNATNARLLLMVAGYTNNHPQIVEVLVYGLNDGHAGENWAEDSINWNSAPGNDVNSSDGLLTAEVTPLGSFFLDVGANPSGTSILFESQELVDFVAADTDGLVTLILVRVEVDAAGTQLAPKENSAFSPPALVLDGVVENQETSFSSVKCLYR